jgi:hypothetical protein
MNPFTIAAKGKGFKNALHRARVITNRYGLTSNKMDRTLIKFARLLESYQVSATFPITAVALKRNAAAIQELVQQGIEFAIHGYTHVDHSLLTTEEQASRLKQAMAIFELSGVPFKGFRCPYLRWNEATLAALRQHHLLYDSSQGLAWNVLDGADTPAYQRVINFYGAQLAQDYPALPHLDHGLIRIPYCLPDDEGLIDRLKLDRVEAQSKIWLEILQQTYQLGELFTLGLHPERIDLLAEPLVVTLVQARTLSPGVWIARLDEIARWWLERPQTKVTLTPIAQSNLIEVIINGPTSITVLARNLEIQGRMEPWFGNYQRILDGSFVIAGAPKPVIGVSPQSSKLLVDFLQQQGYLVEVNPDPSLYTFYLDRIDFMAKDKRPLLSQIEKGDWPLLRLGRWPDGAQSVLCVTGDIDALTLWDYSLRLLGT